MTERRRTSKWDVAVEPKIPVKEADSPSMKANDSHPEWESSKLDTNSFPPPSEVKADPPIRDDENSEAAKLTAWSHREDGTASLPTVRSPSSHFPLLPDMDAVDRDSLKHSHREPLADHMIGKDEDLNGTGDRWNNSVEQNYGTGRGRSPGHDAYRQRSPAISPKRGWYRSNRSRSRSWSRSRSSSRSRSWSRNRGRSRSWSRSRSRSRSPSSGFRRGPERSRSRTPSYASRRGPEKWPGRGRGTGGLTVPCRDFAAGRCFRGSECRFFHEDSGRRQPNRYHDGGGADTRESRGERGRYSGQGRDSREPSDYSRDRFRRNERATTKCYDFIKGRCQRGSDCRYSHDEASYDSGWDTRDEGRARSHDRRDSDPSSGRRLDPSRKVVNDTPCKFFAEGRCRRGESCSYSHQVAGPHDDRSGYSMGNDSRNSSWKGRNQGDAAVVINTSNSSQWMDDGSDSKVNNSRLKPQNTKSQLPERSVHQIQPQGASNPLPLAPVPGKNFVLGGQNQYMSNQPVQAQSFTPNIQIPQLVPPMPLNGQMQQAVFPLPQNNQGQLLVPQNPSNFSVPLQNLAVLDPSQIGLNQQNYNIPPPIHVGQDQQSFSLSGQIQQNLPVLPLNGQNQLNLNFTGQSHQTLPPAHDGQNQNVASQPPNPESLNKNEQVVQRADISEKHLPQVNSDTPITPKVVTSEQAAQITNLSASLAQFFGSASALNPQMASGLVPLVQPNQSSLTPQQSNPTSADMEPVNPDTDNLPPGFEQKDHAIKEVQNNIASPLPLAVTGGTNYGIPPNKGADLEVRPTQGTENTAAKEVNETGIVHNNKEQAEDVEADIRTEGESKQSKDVKGMRLFKCALVEFVKDALKPAWKEGHLSKEAHKTIVKKVVDKVTGAMQSQNIPQTQEKIDVYLTHSKVKLTKLVQAYVDKYVKG